MVDSILAQHDPDVAALIKQEEQRQVDSIRLIASENYASPAVLEAAGSVLSNKYSEGYPGKRYYEGQVHIDAIEALAITRLKALFGSEHVNVQPYSGSPANLAVYFACCRPGDTTMGLGLPSGGHLTHGWKVSISGSYFNSVQYGLDTKTHRIDFDEVARLAKEHRPKLLWCGISAYPRTLDFARFAQIARDSGAILVADIAHISGLVAGGAHPSPVGHAEIITSTTHKTFRGPRGGMILCDAKHQAAIDRAVFPGLQGGPHNAATAGIATAAKQASQPEFREYAQRIIDNAKALGEALLTNNISLVTGGTDNHLLICDLTPLEVSGKTAARALDKAGIVVNANAIPFDPRKPFDPSGIRLGTAAITSRGMQPKDMPSIANWISAAIKHHDKDETLSGIQQEVQAFCGQFPAPGIRAASKAQ